MKNWMLLAQTPRAGRYNHRFIAAPDTSVPEARLQNVFKSARNHNEGAGYISAKEARLQATTQRTGEEILLLVWDDLSLLDAGQKAVLQRWLAQKLKDLDTLVTSHVNWEQEGEPLVVPRPELAQWENELEKECARIFTVAEQIRQQNNQAMAKRKKLIAAGMAAMFLLIMVSGLIVKRQWDAQEQARIDTENAQIAQQAKDELLKKLDSSHCLSNGDTNKEKQVGCDLATHLYSLDMEEITKFSAYADKKEFMKIATMDKELDLDKLKSFIPTEAKSFQEIMQARDGLREDYLKISVAVIDRKICEKARERNAREPNKQVYVKTCELIINNKPQKSIFISEYDVLAAEFINSVCQDNILEIENLLKDKQYLCTSIQSKGVQ